jgi:hypothetical protein
MLSAYKRPTMSIQEGVAKARKEIKNKTKEKKK